VYSSYVEIGFTLSSAAASGGYTATFAVGDLVCGANTNAALAATAVFNVGIVPSAFQFEDSTPTALSAMLELSGVPVAASTAAPFNYISGAYTIRITSTAVDISSAVGHPLNAGTPISTYINLPAGLQGLTWSASHTSTTDLMWTASSLAGVLPGVYDIGLRGNALTDGAGSYFGSSSIRIVVGMPPLVYNAQTLRFSPQSVSANATTAVYATNATFLGIEIPRMLTTNYLNAYYTKVNPISAGASGFDVSASLLPGFATVSSAPASDYATGHVWTFHSMLTEGTYLLPRSGAALTDGTTTDVAAGLSRNLVIIIDRTPPAASNATWAGVAQVVGHSGQFQVPAAMFADAVSSTAAALRVLSIKSTGMDSAHGYYCLAPAPLSGAFCRASSVLGGPATLVFEVVAEDEAGNQARAYLTVPVVADVVPTLSIADNRGVFVTPASSTVLEGASVASTGTLLTGGSATVVANNLVLTVVLTNADPLTGVTFATLSWASVLMGTPTGPSPVSSANGRVWTFTCTFTAVNLYSAAAHSSAVSVAAGDVTRASDGAVSSASSAALAVIFDNAAPTGSVQNAGPMAAVGVPFFAYVPAAMHTADTVLGAGVGTSPWNIAVSAGTTSDVIGLAFTAGKLGRAYISGTAASVPSARASDASCGTFNSGVFVKFTISLTDEAGNTLQKALCVGVASLGTTVSLLTARNTIAVTESTTAKTLDATAVYASTANLYQISLFLETPDDGTAGTGSHVETLALPANGGVTGTTSAYAQPADSNSLPSTSSLVGSITLTNTASSNTITAAQATLVLQGATYLNGLYTMTPGYRTIRIVLSQFSGLVVGYTFKTVSVSNVNQAPAITGTVGAAWTEGQDFYASGVPIFSAADVAITDNDDTALTAATVTLATAAGTGPTHGACDPSRDFLALNANYTTASVVPGLLAIAGVWAPASCTLTLRPVGAASAPIASFVTAISAVVYRNSDRFNPSNGFANADGGIRLITVTVTDAAAGGKASAPATSASISGVTVPTLVDDPPTVFFERVYGPGGVGYSTNETALVWTPSSANLASIFPGYPSSILNIRKAPLLTAHAGGAATFVNTITVDLSGLANSGSYGNGALVDPDTTAILVAGDLTLTAVDTTNAGAAFTGATISGVTVSATGVATFTITVDEATVVGGTFGVKVTCRTVSFTLWFDQRVAACLDAYAAGNLAQLVPDADSCTTINLGSTGHFVYPVAASTGNTDAAVPSGQTVSMPSKNTANGGSASNSYVGTITAGAFNFQDNNASAAQVRHDLIRAGVPDAEAAAYTAATRAANRNLASFYFEANAFSTASGTLAFGYTPVGFATAATLPPVNAGEVLDASLMYLLTPAGASFAFPVTVCLFTGDTPAGYTRAMRVVSQLSSTDASRGWGAWESASGVTYDAVTGLLCGNSSHFSVFAPVLVPLAAGATVSKAVTMGGACPNDCSGKGYCRAAGRCSCFAGFLRLRLLAAAVPRRCLLGRGRQRRARRRRLRRPRHLQRHHGRLRVPARVRGRGMPAHRLPVRLLGRRPLRAHVVNRGREGYQRQLCGGLGGGPPAAVPVRRGLHGPGLQPAGLPLWRRPRDDLHQHGAGAAADAQLRRAAGGGGRQPRCVRPL